MDSSGKGQESSSLSRVAIGKVVENLVESTGGKQFKWRGSGPNPNGRSPNKKKIRLDKPETEDVAS